MPVPETDPPLDGLTDTLTVVTPVPVRGMLNGLSSGSLEEILIVADFTPTDVGENAT